jgi:pilus assembly protein CpaE
VAVWLRRATKKPTLLLDLDLDLGSAALLLGIQPRYTLVDVVRNFHRMEDDLLASYVERHDSGLHLLAPPSRLDLSHNFTREQIESLVAYLRRWSAEAPHPVFLAERRIAHRAAASGVSARYRC